MKVLVVGDVHGQFAVSLYPLLQLTRPDFALFVGDFGYYPYRRRAYHPETNERLRCNPNDIYRGKRSERHSFTSMHFCDGNHEDHAALRDLVLNGGVNKKYNPSMLVKNLTRLMPVPTDYKPISYEVAPNVHYHARGSTLTLPNGKVVLFVGGADSVDKDTRVPGYDWFKDEILTLDDFNHFPDVNVDVVISHTCPTYFDVNTNDEENYYGYDKYSDPSRKVLDLVFDKYKPTQWYFGHWHLSQSDVYKDCSWTLLNTHDTDPRVRVNVSDGFNDWWCYAFNDE